ncbi:MAG: DNA polymerase III subunit delta [Candidatus Anammoxibacter sp.]
MDYNSFEKSIKSNERSPAYVVFGEERFLVKQALLLIKEKELDKDNIDLTFTEYNGTDVSFGQIFDELWTASLLGGDNKRLVLIEDAGDLLKKYKKKVQEYLKSPSPYACPVFVSDKIDAWIKKIPNNKLTTVECKKLRDYQLPSWITARGRRYRKKIVSEASKALIGETGNDLVLLDNHIAKLSTYVGDRETIDEGDVHAIIFDGKKQTVFELTNAMADKDAANALEILKRLITFGEDFSRVISILGWQVRRLWKAKRIVKDCSNNALNIAKRLQEELKINNYFLKGFVKQVERFSENDLQVKFGYIADADVAIKTSSLAPRIIVECLLIKLCK